MRKWLMVGSAVAAIGLAACGGGGESATETGGGGGDAAPAETTTLSLVDNAFEPETLSVSSGATVEVTNDGQAPHTVTIEGESIDQEFEAGQSGSVTFDLEPGDYTMFCEFHREAGMEGTLTVS